MSTGTRTRWLLRELRFWWVWRKHPEVRRAVSPQPPPAEAVERLRRRVESGEWD